MKANLLSIVNGKAPAPKIFASPAPQRVRPSPSETASRSFARQRHSPNLPPQTPSPTVNTNISSSSLPGPRSSEAQAPSFSASITSSDSVMASSFTSTLCEDTPGCSVVIPFSRTGRIRSVHKFLETAEPPMTHMLHRFIDFGCLGEDFLITVSRWSTERIRTFLWDLPPGPRGKAMNEMEVEVLTHHFESYFLGYSPETWGTEIYAYCEQAKTNSKHRKFYQGNMLQLSNNYPIFYSQVGENSLML